MTICIQWTREKYVISETDLYMKFIGFSSTMPVTSIHVLVESTLWIINVWILLSYFQMWLVFLEFWINIPCCAFQNHKSQQLSQTKYDWPSRVKEDHDRDHLDNTIALTKPVNTSVLSSMCGMDLSTVSSLCCCKCSFSDSLKVVEHLMSLYETSFSLFYRGGLKSFSSS
jgi:hypothetical protein